MGINKYISVKRKIINKALEGYLPSSSERPSLIHRAMRYAVFTGGKRIRPVLTVAGFEACGGRGNAIMPVACAIELIHTYTLIHDDLPCMDNDDYRRGKLSCHKKFGEAIALLAGDSLLTLGFQLLSKAGNVDIISEVSKAIGSKGTVGGQVVDIGTGRRRDLDYIVSHKTGLLFETAIKVAGIFKGVGAKKINALGNFGRGLGFTFQLIDDLIDGDGYVSRYGKNYVREKARKLTGNGKRYLSVFGKGAKNLSEISDLILERKS
ncbi:MAG: polyprenyl synthetase family protein [Candidatus Omnitrophota bacterium]|jgi:geranylgeranyl diphosphate synthase type II|nr:polyprenyl synthetase family protein [Candidatus Omnitrophota bacterium]